MWSDWATKPSIFVNMKAFAASFYCVGKSRQAPQKGLSQALIMSLRRGQKVAMSDSQVTDRELVRKAQAGEKQAFGRLVERYQKRVYAVALGMLHNPDDALDVVQDAFVKVHKHIGSFQGNASFYTWLYRIVSNLCIDVQRKRKRRQHQEFNEAVAHSETPMSGVDVTPRLAESDPVTNLSRRELSRQMNKALDALSENHRVIILLREVDGLSYDDLARVLKVSKGTVMSRLFHARKNLQTSLRPYLGLKENQGLDGLEIREESGEKPGSTKQENGSGNGVGLAKKNGQRASDKSLRGNP